MRTCGYCKEEKQDELFRASKPYCKACLKVKAREYYVKRINVYGKPSDLPGAKKPGRPRTTQLGEPRKIYYKKTGNPIGRPKKILDEKKDEKKKVSSYKKTGNPIGRPPKPYVKGTTPWTRGFKSLTEEDEKKLVKLNRRSTREGDPLLYDHVEALCIKNNIPVNDLTMLTEDDIDYIDLKCTLDWAKVREEHMNYVDDYRDGGSFGYPDGGF